MNLTIQQTLPRNHKRPRFPRILLRDGYVWFAGTATLIILAHTGAIAGWVMHLCTEILTFRFAIRIGRWIK